MEYLRVVPVVHTEERNDDPSGHELMARQFARFVGPLFPFFGSEFVLSAAASAAAAGTVAVAVSMAVPFSLYLLESSAILANPSCLTQCAMP